MSQQTVEAPPRQEERLAMTYEEWLIWAEGNVQAEWVNGEGIKFVPPDPEHGIASFLAARLLADFVELFDLGVVLHSPLEMRLEMIPSSREPDVLFIARDHLHRIGPTRIEGPVDVAVEFISPDSVRRDRVEKLAEYEAAGIMEYWLFDARRGKERSDFYRLNAQGRYELVPLDADGRYHSVVVPRFWLRPEWLWQIPRPKVRSLLDQIAPNVR
jgi:Uma2 family endonuclease